MIFWFLSFCGQQVFCRHARDVLLQILLPRLAAIGIYLLILLIVAILKKRKRIPS
jgi:hypothetical protein